MENSDASTNRTNIVALCRVYITRHSSQVPVLAELRTASSLCSRKSMRLQMGFADGESLALYQQLLLATCRVRIDLFSFLALPVPLDCLRPGGLPVHEGSSERTKRIFMWV
jgi:hypothetical protein